MIGVPSKIYAGMSLIFTAELLQFKASLGWVLKVIFTGTSESFSVTATASGDSYVVSVAPDETKDYAAGQYRWKAIVEKTGDTPEKHLVGTGWATILANPVTTEGADMRTHARKMLDAIEATLEGRATKEQTEITINGRSLKLLPPSELIAVRNYYRSEVKREEDEEKMLRGERVVSKNVLAEFK